LAQAERDHHLAQAEEQTAIILFFQALHQLAAAVLDLVH
jgi:hypothetical protein